MPNMLINLFDVKKHARFFIADYQCGKINALQNVSHY